MFGKKCYVCGYKNFKKRPGRVRDSCLKIDVLECINCGLVFLSSVNHITENFYEESGMHVANVEIDSWLKETEWDDERRIESVK